VPEDNSLTLTNTGLDVGVVFKSFNCVPEPAMLLLIITAPVTYETSTYCAVERAAEVIGNPVIIMSSVPVKPAVEIFVKLPDTKTIFPILV
jgi:hypothetical protein